MILNFISNLIAFFLGSVLVLLQFLSNDSFHFIFTNSDNYIFLLKSIVSGIIALAVKVFGELLISKLKSKKQKDE